MRTALEALAESVLYWLMIALIMTGLGFACGASCGAVERGYELMR